MGSCFYLVLNMSLTAAAAGLVILLARALFRALPAAARHALWSVVLLRLLLPVSVPSEASFFNAVGRYFTRIVSVPAGDTGATMTNMIGAASGYAPLRFRTGALAAAFGTAGAVWAAGALACAACALALYLMTARRLGTAVRLDSGGLMERCAAEAGVKRKVGLYASEAVSSPVVFGVFRPRVVIPPGLARESGILRYALLHELAHIKRGDNVWRALSAAVLCAHWINPLMWLFLTLAGRDMELACDAGVLKRLDEAERRGYALALAALAASRQPLLAPAFGQSAVKQRIIGIVRYKRLTVAAAVLTALFLLALAVILLSNPMV